MEERDTALEYGVQWREWLEIGSEERAGYVAHRRVRLLLELHRAKAMNDHQRAQIERQRARS